MCGISAFIGKNKGIKDLFIGNSIDMLSHRGPDDFGVWQENGATEIALVHRRLSIQDLSDAGKQPMISQNERFVLIFNGEIYNHLDLRSKYFPRKIWNGHSDTETLLALIDLMKEDCFQHLVGMWALACWDRQEKKLLISRDRFGQKPIYYLFKDGSFLLSSEIKPLLTKGEKNPINSLMAAEYLALGNYGHLGEQTFFKNIFQLLPGHYAWISHSDSNIKSKPYWNLPKVRSSEKITVGKKEIISLKECIVEAVRSQTLSDVPIGASLSGGLDSSVVVGILANYFSETNPISVFTAQTPKSEFEETKFVKKVVEKWEPLVNLYQKDLNQVKISEYLVPTLMIQEEPFGDPSIIAHGFLMDMASELGIKVVLGGQGADELFRGYLHSIKQLFSHELGRFNFWYAAKELPNLSLGLAENSRILLGAFLPKLERALRKKSRKNRRDFISSQLQNGAEDLHLDSLLSLPNNWDDAVAESFMKVHIPHLVHYDDRNGMARSIEGRMPFLDHRILELISTFKPADFYRNGFSKSLLREATREYIPNEVYLRRDKLGFYTPLNKLLNDELNFVKEILSGSIWVQDEYKLRALKMIEKGRVPNHESEKIWRVICLTKWAELFDITY